MKRLVAMLALFALPGIIFAQGADLSQIGTDPRRALIVEVFLNADGSTDFIDSYVSTTPPRTDIGNPRQIQVEALDVTDVVIDTVYDWDPRWLFAQQDSPDDSGLSGEQLEVLDESAGSFLITFDSAMAEIRLTDVEAINELITVDVRPVVETWCYEELQASSPAGLANCTGIEFTDTDFDDVPNAVDNCPDIANTDQSDVLNRGIGDACARPGDLDGDGDVDWNDIGLYLAGNNLNRPANDPVDPFDLNDNGTVNILDARAGILLCDLPRCAILP
ncbi:MAG: hypothetical protein HKN56_10675 [Gammaproteobacteria bacterium]|nr:hypothetical protein [Gammaproteobacteria bacterium]